MYNPDNREVCAIERRAISSPGEMPAHVDTWPALLFLQDLMDQPVEYREHERAEQCRPESHH